MADLAGVAEPAPPAVAPATVEPPGASEALWIPSGPNTWTLALVHPATIRLIDPSKGTATFIRPEAGRIDRVSVVVPGGAGEGFVGVTAGGKTASLWSTTAKRLTTFPWTKTENVVAIALSKDAKRVALLRDDRVVVGLVDGDASTKPLAEFETGSNGASVAFHDDGKHLVVVSYHSALVFDLAKQAAVGDPHGTDTGGTFPTVLSSDGRWVAASTAAGHQLTVWQTVPWKRVAQLGKAPDCQNHVACAFSDDGRTLFGSAGTAWSKQFAAGSWRVTRAANPGKGAKDTYTSLSDDGQIGLRGEAPKIALFDTKTKGALGTLELGEGEATSLSPDGKYIVRFGEKGFALLETRGLHPVALQAK